MFIRLLVVTTFMASLPLAHAGQASFTCDGSLETVAVRQICELKAAAGRCVRYAGYHGQAYVEDNCIRWPRELFKKAITVLSTASSDQSDLGIPGTVFQNTIDRVEDVFEKCRIDLPGIYSPLSPTNSHYTVINSDCLHDHLFDLAKESGFSCTD